MEKTCPTGERCSPLQVPASLCWLDIFIHCTMQAIASHSLASSSTAAAAAADDDDDEGFFIFFFLLTCIFTCMCVSM